MIVLSHNPCRQRRRPSGVGLAESLLWPAIRLHFRRLTMPTNTTNQNRTSQQRTAHQTRREESTMHEAGKPVSELFEQAMSSYEQAFRTGLRLQEESGKWWTTLFEQNGPSHEWQKTMRTMANELLPEAQKRMEDGLRFVEQNSRASLELLKLFKKSAVPVNNPLAESQTKLLSFWEAS